MHRRQLLVRAAALAAAVPAVPALLTPAQARPVRDTRPADVPEVLPSRTEILDAARSAADHWISTHADPGDNGWANATFFSGLLALYRATEEPRYLDYASGWAESHDYGLNNGVTTRHADDHNAGQAYLDLYELAPDEAKIAAIEESLTLMVTEHPEQNDDWWWDDALHMAMPPFARLSVLREDREDRDGNAFAAKLHALYTHTKSAQGGPGLLDPDTGLWYRDNRFLPGGIASPNGLPVFWSRGCGWVAAGHAKTLKALPEQAPHTAEYRATLVDLLTAVGEVQRDDGFFNVSLADPEHLPGPETSGTAFFAYATGYAVAAGLLPESHLAVAARAWNGMVATALQPDGFLGYVQGVGDRPEASQPITAETTADFGVGGFLLAAVELAGVA